jgi:hypothetical protein
MGYPAETTDGETVMIVDKAPLGNQGMFLLTDENGNQYTADHDSIQVKPYNGETGLLSTAAGEEVMLGNQEGGFDGEANDARNVEDNSDERGRYLYGNKPGDEAA